MLNYFLKIVLVLTVMMFTTGLFYGQSKIDTIVLKKGEVLDILLLTQNPNVELDLKSYFKTAFPVAKKMSYQPISGFKISNYTQGNIRPNSLVLGKWSDLKKRKEFLAQIVNEVPDFHEQRRNIWSFFGLKYFEIEEDLSLEINKNRYNVATAYWFTSKNKSSEFYKKWEKSIQKLGGNMVIRLTNGDSPFGYQYNPDFFVITSWANEADFKSFQKNIQYVELDNIQHINEFILD